MSDNKSYRIKANIQSEDHVDINLNLNQDIDVFEFLSMKIGTQNFYRFHTADYGCVAGRVLANNSVGVPNVKLSIFIEADENTKADSVLYYLYPYSNTNTINDKKIKYNLLPEDKLYDCHQNVGTFPSKRMVLDDNNVFEIFDKYYKFTTTTNSAGDYMIFGVPTGSQILHMDVDLSDIGDLLSQRPRDFIYKGYNATQFENSNMFKKDNNLNTLVQIMSQDESVVVQPFWGEAEEMGELDSTGVRITRKDINLNYKFEPTCIFMGSLITDEKSNGFTARCIPTERMGKMDRITTGEGTIEMIRKTPDGEVEEYSVQGNQLIDGNGTWCYQIPMNLDYVRTDEYGNIVPTSDAEKGMPTRARVRFRVSLTDFQSDYQNNHLVKMLVPNNPDPNDGKNHYVFGTYTPESDFRDLFWNKVYSVKSFIPRLQKSNWNKDKRFSGIKAVNVNGNNNPVPYNNMRINITFLFTLQCAIMHILLWIVGVVNRIISAVAKLLAKFSNTSAIQWDKDGDKEGSLWPKLKCLTIGDGACPDLEGWYFAPGCSSENFDATAKGAKNPYNLLRHTYESLADDRRDEVGEDENSTDFKNGDSTDICLTNKIDYFIQCIEIALAQEYEVIQFDFYNDWINGLLYIPRWFGRIRKKKSFLFGLIKVPQKTLACIEDNVNFQRRYTQQCALDYHFTPTGADTFSDIKVNTLNGCQGSAGSAQQVCHKGKGRKFVFVKGGYVKSQATSRGESVYYFKPNGKSLSSKGDKKVNYFATDVILLGSLNEHDIDGIPQTFKGLVSSTYQMPTNLAATNMDIMGYMYGNSNGSSVCKNQQFVDGECTDKDKRPAGVTKGNIVQIFRYMGIPFYSNTYRDYLTKDCGLVGQHLADEVANSIGRQKKIFRNTVSKGYKYCDKIRSGEVSLLCAAYSDGGSLSSTIEVQQLPDTFSTYKTWGSADDTSSGGSLNDENEYEITEAAGIDWGYTGPGQGEADRDNIYQPGGHFLGIACFNAESNVKSCINLSRACEIGVSLSQRQAIVKRVGDNVVNKAALIPTGMISRNEVSDSSFRAEFATLNHNGLETRINPITQRTEYNFLSLAPVGFDGALEKVNGAQGYNNLEGNIRKAVSEQAEEEKEYAFTREMTDMDYLRFRLGLKDLKRSTLGTAFLLTEGSLGTNSLRLPVYNNSYYFYFGLHDGATALDRFYKEFYSECPDINEGKIITNITVTDADPCDFYGRNKGKAEIRVIGLEAEETYIYSITNSDGIVMDSDTITGQNSFEYSTGALYIGAYSFELKSSDGESIVREDFTISIVRPEWLNDIAVTYKDFTKKKDDNLEDEVGRGYVEISWKANSEAATKLSEVYVDGNTEDNIFPNAQGGETKRIRQYLKYGNQSYTVKVKSNSCDGYFEISTFFCSMPSEMDLFIGGSQDVTYRKTLEGNESFDPSQAWWVDYLTGGTAEEKFFIEKAVTYKDSLSNWDKGSVDVTPNGGVDTTIIDGTWEKEGPITGNKKALYLSNEEKDDYSISYTNFDLPTRNVPDPVIGYKIVLGPNSKNDYMVSFYDINGNRLPNSVENDIGGPDLRLPSIYKPFFFRSVMFRNMAKDENGDPRDGKSDVYYDMTVANGTLFNGKFKTVFLCEEDIVKDGNIVDQSKTKYSAFKQWWNNTGGNFEDFPTLRSSGMTSLDYTTPGALPEEYYVIVEQNQPSEGTYTPLSNDKGAFHYVRFIGDSSHGASTTQYNTDVKYFMLYGTDSEGKRLSAITSLTNADYVRYVNAIAAWLRKIHTSKADGTIEEGLIDDVYYWPGSCEEFTISASTVGDGEYFSFKPSANMINLTDVFSGKEVLNIDTNLDSFVLGIYDPWTQLTDDEFMQVANKTVNTDKYDYVGKDTDMFTIISLYDAKTFETIIMNNSLPPVLEWLESYTIVSKNGTGTEERFIRFRREYISIDDVEVEVKNEPAWITAAVVPGNKVKIEVLSNETGEMRNATLILHSKTGDTTSDEMTVTQLAENSPGSGIIEWDAYQDTDGKKYVNKGNPVSADGAEYYSLTVYYSGVVGTPVFSTQDSWVVVKEEKYRPTSNGTIFVNILPNDSTQERRATLTITAHDDDGDPVSDSCILIQAGKEVEPYVEWTNGDTHISSDATTITAEYTFEGINESRGTYVSVWSDQMGWIRAENNSANTEATLTVGINPSRSERSAEVQVRATATNGTRVSDVFILTQAGNDSPMIVSPASLDWTFKEGMLRQNIEVTADTSYTAAIDNTGFTINPTAGEGIGTIIATPDGENTGYVDRTATVTVTDGTHAFNVALTQGSAPHTVPSLQSDMNIWDAPSTGYTKGFTFEPILNERYFFRFDGQTEWAYFTKADGTPVGTTAYWSWDYKDTPSPWFKIVIAAIPSGTSTRSATLWINTYVTDASGTEQVSSYRINVEQWE